MLRHRSLSLINATWAVPVVIFVRIMRPLIFIRIGRLFSGRIGHFVPDAAEHSVKKSLQVQRTYDFYYFFGGICNDQWAKMVRRNLKIKGGWLKYIWHWNNFIPGGAKHNLPQSFTNSRDPQGLLTKIDVSYDFLPEENKISREWLRSKGWKEGEPFICLQVRDSAYLDKFDPNKGDLLQDEHSYRNSSIESYLPAINWLTSQGIWVLRMGKLMSEPLGKIDRLIDYAFDEEKSDLLDIWLFANCDACISTSTGPDWISALYRKPLLFVNALPLGVLFSMFYSVWVPKKLSWKDSGLNLNLSEYLENLYLRTSQYVEAGINITDLTPEEILLATQEFWGRIQGTWDDTDEETKRQDEFWNHFVSWAGYPKYHEWRHPMSRVGSSWLKSSGKDFMSIID